MAALFVSCNKEVDKPQEDPDPKPIDNPDPPKPEAPVIVTEATASVKAAAGTYPLAATVENPVEGKNLSVSVADAPAWLTAAVENGTVQLTVTDNLSAPRKAQLTLSYPEAGDMSVELTQEQWRYSEFDIQISNIGPFGATFDITRKAGYGGGYFFEVLDKSSFLKYVKDDTHKIGDFAYGEALYQSDLAYLNRLSEQHGHALSALFPMLQSMYSKEETTKMPYSGLSVDTDYIFIVYGMDDNTAARKTAMCFYEFHTGYSSESGLTFSGMAMDVTENYAELTVTPSNNSEYWYMDWVSEIQLSTTTLAEVMQKSIDNAKSWIGRYTAEQILCHGPETIQATDLMPGTTYTVVAWGMNLDMAATTEPKVAFTFRTKDYAIVDDCSFDIQVLEVEDMDIKVRVTPTNLDTRYYVAFVAKSLMEGYSDEQAAQRIINMESSRIEKHYYDVENLGWDNLPGLLPGIREIWGRRDEGWTFLPEHDYRIYAFGIDNFGIRSTAVSAIDVTTAEAGQSFNHFTMNVASNTWQGLDVTITPEINDEYWLYFLAEKSDIDAYCRNADGSLNESLIFQWIEEYYEDEINYYAYAGEHTVHLHVTPDMDYVFLVFGYAGAPTTSMTEWDIHVPAPPLGKSTADFTYTYELFRGEDLANLDPRTWPHADYDGDCIMNIRLQVTDNAAHWYLGVWPPMENFQEQGGQYYLMTLDMNPDVSMQDKKFYRTRPWWYGSGEGYVWHDTDGTVVNHWPWSISGWAEDAEGNYGPWHYELFIPVPVPKDTPGMGRYEVGYTEAYDFWSAPAATSGMQVYSVNRGQAIELPFSTIKYQQ